MATNPKIKPCPTCKNDDHIALYTYESGARRVECNKCQYLGPAGVSLRWAIKLHNEKWEARQTARPETQAGAR